MNSTIPINNQNQKLSVEDNNNLHLMHLQIEAAHEKSTNYSKIYMKEKKRKKMANKNSFICQVLMYLLSH